jgi:hypothetical protein
VVQFVKVRFFRFFSFGFANVLHTGFVISEDEGRATGKKGSGEMRGLGFGCLKLLVRSCVQVPYS